MQRCHPMGKRLSRHVQGATEQLVLQVPEFFTKPILPDQDEFLILACDRVRDASS